MRLLRHCSERHNQRTIDRARYHALDERAEKIRKYGRKSIESKIAQACGEVP